MLDRRQFGFGVGSAAAALAAPAIAQPAPKKIRIALASGVSDAQVAFQTIAMHPRIGWAKDENIELEIINTSSAATAVQLLANRQVELATTSAFTLLPLYADNPSLNLICAYTWTPRTIYGVVTKPDSAIRSIADLKGKTIGIRNTGDGGYLFLQGMFREIGIDPQKDVEWLSVGAGGPAGQALYRDTVQAIAIWDAEFVRIEIAGFALRTVPNIDSARIHFGNAYAANAAFLEGNTDLFARAFRAIAKGQVFTAANPRAAILLHWDLFPETKPKGKTDAEALAEMTKLLETRRDKWFPQADSADQRMGAVTPEQWAASLAFMSRLNPKVRDKVTDVTKLYTNALLDAANRFDRAAIEEQARGFKI
jgi:NitT/TauT family transport system substrate-binding protein